MGPEPERATIEDSEEAEDGTDADVRRWMEAEHREAELAEEDGPLPVVMNRWTALSMSPQICRTLLDCVDGEPDSLSDVCDSHGIRSEANADGLKLLVQVDHES
jgi:hypothetical protein